MVIPQPLLLMWIAPRARVGSQVLVPWSANAWAKSARWSLLGSGVGWFVSGGAEDFLLSGWPVLCFDEGGGAWASASDLHQEASISVRECHAALVLDLRDLGGG
ncbi:hypothetical protein GCM10009839_13140 [Catenulispora yoronensis]|uniref:Secreted protein n=1 Tax=Catenulispora yoronensis TaxID=450799 RepID=A0ABP5F6C8_9ACTN